MDAGASDDGTVTTEETSMDRLAERLRDLAQDAPHTPPDPGLVARARHALRLRRRRRTGTAVIAVVGAVLVIASVLLTDPARLAQPVPPAPADRELPLRDAVLPDTIWNPDPWLPGTDETGPPGPLVAVVEAQRGVGWRGREPGLVGVSATTSEYRFLDLPDRADDSPVVLSPDGRLVAYWWTGEAPGAYFTTLERDVLGPAVYDTVTGEVRRQNLGTEYGLSPSGIAMSWVGSEALVVYPADVQFAEYMDPVSREEMEGEAAYEGHYRLQPPVVWSLMTDRLMSVESGVRSAMNAATDSPSQIRTASDDHALWKTEDGWRRIDLDRSASVDRDPPVAFRLGPQANDDVSLVLSPDGHRVATLWSGPRAGSIVTPNRLMVSTLGDPGAARIDESTYPGTRIEQVVAWPEPDRILALTRETRRTEPDPTDWADDEPEEPEPPKETFRLVTIDPTDPDATEQVLLTSHASIHAAAFATDLLDAPVVRAPAPQRVISPTQRAAAPVLLGGFAVAAVILWRRRVAR